MAKIQLYSEICLNCPHWRHRCKAHHADLLKPSLEEISLALEATLDNPIEPSLMQFSRPRIGIPIPHDYFQREPLWGNSGDYRGATEIGKAVERAGGEPVLLYPDGDCHEIQGLVLPGGSDVAPHLYGQQAHPEVREVDLDLDLFQIRWARWALTTAVPMLGICRGMQVMNVAAGGTLVQHVTNAEFHFPQSARRDASLKSVATHRISLQADSLLSRLLGGGETHVNSRHHQAVDDLSSQFRPTAWSEDGVVEAMESSDAWHLGVQFHPEDLRHSDSRFEAIFQGLVQQAGRVDRERLPLSA